MKLRPEYAKINSGGAKITLTPLPKTAVRVTKEEYEKLMRIYNAVGWRWCSGEKPLNHDFWGDDKIICVSVGNLISSEETKGDFEYASLLVCDRKGWKIISFAEFLKAQGLKRTDISSA